MGEQEYDSRNFQELLMFPRAEYEAMSIEKRRAHANKLNRAIDEATSLVNESFSGLCPACRTKP